MADELQSNRIVCIGGLDATQNHLSMAVDKPGAATRLVNYEVGLGGGYRRVEGFAPLHPDFPEVGVGLTQGPVLDIAIFNNSTTGRVEYYALRRSLAAPTTYTVWKLDPILGWQLVTTGLTRLYTSGALTTTRFMHDVGNDGLKNYLVFVDGVNPAMMFDGTNWVEIKSTNAGTSYAVAGGNQALDAPTVVRFFMKTLWIGADQKNGKRGTIAYSAPAAFFDFLFANGANQAVCGMDIRNYRPFREELFVFANNSIKKIILNGTDFLVKDVTANLGLVAEDVLIELGGDLVFLGPDGFRPVSGTDKIGDVQLETISKDIHDLVRRKLLSVPTQKVLAIPVRGKSQMRVFFSNELVPATATGGIIGGLRTADAQNGWEWGELRGFRATCVDSAYIDTEEYVLHGDYDGIVYRQENGNTASGEPLFAVYSTPFLDMGDTEVRKTPRKITIYFKGEGGLDLTVGIENDWGDTQVINPPDYLIHLESQAAEYGDGSEYGGDEVYGGRLQARARTNLQGSFFSTRVTFQTDGSDAPYSIHGIVFEYSVEGRI